MSNTNSQSDILVDLTRIVFRFIVSWTSESLVLGIIQSCQRVLKFCQVSTLGNIYHHHHFIRMIINSFVMNNPVINCYIQLQVYP